MYIKWFFYGTVTVFGFPVEPAFLINYDTLLQEIDEIEAKYGIMSEISVLKKNLQEYEGIFAFSSKKEILKSMCFKLIPLFFVLFEKVNKVLRGLAL